MKSIKWDTSLAQRSDSTENIYVSCLKRNSHNSWYLECVFTLFLFSYLAKEISSFIPIRKWLDWAGANGQTVGSSLNLQNYSFGAGQSSRLIKERTLIGLAIIVPDSTTKCHI